MSGENYEVYHNDDLALIPYTVEDLKDCNNFRLEVSTEAIRFTKLRSSN